MNPKDQAIRLILRLDQCRRVREADTGSLCPVCGKGKLRKVEVNFCPVCDTQGGLAGEDDVIRLAPKTREQLREALRL